MAFLHEPDYQLRGVVGAGNFLAELSECWLLPVGYGTSGFITNLDVKGQVSCREKTSQRKEKEIYIY